MKKLSKLSLLLCGLGSLSSPSLLAKPVDGSAVQPAAAHADLSGQAKVQIAILLDTSSSMDGLIEQAKSELWSIVNTFNSAHKDGKSPYVEVALYEYGKQTLNAESHWQRCIVPFSRDLDKVSEELFNLKTNGGDEYCGAVIQRAVSDMQWDENKGTYKAIFIAGNEPFTQGPVNVTASCHAAKKKGVIVNTIHCGAQTTGVQEGWNIGPVVAGGSLLTIDHNAAVEHIVAPQDKLIISLNVELNKTYLPYGSLGASSKLRQEAQDANSVQKANAGAHVKRALCKSSHNYSNGSWDLVDASARKEFDWSALDKQSLPKEMQAMSEAQLKAHVAQNRKTRTEIQAKIQQADKERQAFIAQARKSEAEKTGATLDTVVVGAVRKQAKALGYVFK